MRISSWLDFLANYCKDMVVKVKIIDTIDVMSLMMHYLALFG